MNEEDGLFQSCMINSWCNGVFIECLIEGALEFENCVENGKSYT